MRRASLLVCFVFLLVPFAMGCPIPESPAAKMQDVATDFNTDVRFGRTEIAVEKVAPGEREAFIKRRKSWGKDVALADYEMVGAKMVDGDNAEVSIKYDWYHLNEGDLHVTTIRQKWQSKKGDWKLMSESRIDGDPGIFGEDGPRPHEVERPRSVQFPTVKLSD